MFLVHATFEENNQGQTCIISIFDQQFHHNFFCHEVKKSIEATRCLHGGIYSWNTSLVSGTSFITIGIKTPTSSPRSMPTQYQIKLIFVSPFFVPKFNGRSKSCAICVAKLQELIETRAPTVISRFIYSNGIMIHI